VPVGEDRSSADGTVDVKPKLLVKGNIREALARRAAYGDPTALLPFAGQREIAVALLRGKVIAVDRSSFDILTFKKNGSLAWPLSDRHGPPRRVVARGATRSPLAGCASDLSARELTSLTTSGTSGSMRKAVRLKPRLARPIGRRRTTAVIKLAPELLIAVAAFGIPASYYSRGSHPPH
jgi:hypothetical protein